MTTSALRWLGWISLAACSAGDDVPAPSISTIAPDHAMAGISVTVSGSYLCQQPQTMGESDPLGCVNVGTVSFDRAPGIVTQYTDTMVMVDVPSLPPGTCSVTLSVAGRTSNSIDFTID